MDYGQLVSSAAQAYGGSSGGKQGAPPPGDGGGGGNSGYGSSEKLALQSGGTNKAAFGSINFGAGAKVGGTSTAEGDAGTGASQTFLYVGIGVVALVALVVLMRR